MVRVSVCFAAGEIPSVPLWVAAVPRVGDELIIGDRIFDVRRVRWGTGKTAKRQPTVTVYLES